MPNPVLLRRLGFAAGAAVLAELAATVLCGHGLGGAAMVPYPDLTGDVLIVVAAVLLTSQRPVNPIGWLLLAFAALGATQNLASVYGVRAFMLTGQGWPFGPLALSLGDSLWIAALFLPLTLLPVLYPDGHLPAPWWRWVNRAAVTGMVLATVVAATDAGAARDDVAGGRPIAVLEPGPARTIGVTAALLLAPTVVLSVGGLLRRSWTAPSPQRAQMLWLLTTALIAGPALFLTQGHWLFAVALALVPLAVTVGVLRYRLLGIELAVRRILVYAVLTAFVVGIYAATSALISALVPAGPEPAVVAAAAVAVVLSPVRDRLQRLVDRLVYGARHDPLAAVRQVGTEVSVVSADPLGGVLAAVASSVRASYAAVVDPAGVVVAATGTPDPTRHNVRALSIGGEHLGDLVIAAAAGERALAGPDQRIVDALAVPVAMVVHADRLNRELAAARQRLVAATEAERARLRHDLHDGLGPSLSGVGLGLEALQRLAMTDADRAAQITIRLRTEVAQAVDEVRRIIDALAPGAVEQAGLIDALRRRATAAMDASGITIDLSVAADLPGLPDATVAAVYRIVDEATTNVLRHAGATRCVIRISAGAELTIEVHDNGRGWAGPRPGGIGLTSMRRRAEQLGGTFTATGHDGGHILVRLPLARTAPAGEPEPAHR